MPTEYPVRPMLATLLSLSLACASAQRPRNPADGAALTLVNRGPEPVCYLYASPPNQDDWGPDLLGSDTISPGESHVVQMPRGQVDLRAENCQHEATGVLRGARLTRATTLVLQ